ncbi:MAG: hypothetical protein PUK59_07115 [Actinomycetaceae bacterium]|nr:hypothetical protein [Actinomycetaceae bacterium]
MTTTYLQRHEIPQGFEIVEHSGVLSFLAPAGDFELTLDPFPSTTTWQLVITLTDVTDVTGAAIVFQHQIWALEGVLAGQSHTFNVTPSGARKLNFYGFPDTGVTVRVAITNTARLDSAHRVALLAHLPSPIYNTAIIGKAIIGAFILPSATVRTDWTILGRSYVGASFLYETPDFYEWRTITSAATNIDINRGIDATALTRKAAIGTLAAQFIDQLDPTAYALNRGTPIIAIDTMTRRRLFTGKIDAIQSVPSDDNKYTVTLTALDAVADLSAKRIYQRTEHLPAYWRTAFTQLLDGYHYQLGADAGRPFIGKMVKEATLAEYLDIYAATCNASWYVNSNGQIVVTCEADASTPKYGIAVQTDRGVRGIMLDPVAVNAEINTADLCTGIEFSNNTAVYDAEQREWTSETTAATITNATLARQYGEHLEQLEVAGDLDDIKAYYAGKIALYDPIQGISDVELLAYDWARYIDEPDLATHLINAEIGDTCEVSYRNQAPILETISRIEHHISPIHWSSKVTLNQQ